MQKLRTSAAHKRRISKAGGSSLQIIHDVAGVVIYLDAGVVDFARDSGAGHAAAGFAAVLLDHQQHAVLAGDRPEPPNRSTPELA